MNPLAPAGVSRKVQVALAALVALLLFLVLALAIRATPAWPQQPGTPNDYGALADVLFGPLVIPFEVLGILLTAAMIGALVTARPLTVHGTEESSLVHPNLAETPVAVLPASDAPVPTAAPAPLEAQP
ncbi:MAG TPA: NADH-quinone oxidoreductase subunit J [Candidatus Thermoplasmatota archaeon]|nr:NADH-quinone oxidoreductase subunit J [Candidatus Thermoplasmatota archaeon]